ncbi:MAG: HAMP domain-containing histidine kinase [Lachnospiraceae bacterium]|nr:HAMP domain-containing histidine kinase [Lachnospiraceae bacterium]
MDTKLKKSHKLKNLIIALIVLIPAMVLVCLYPQMETAMLDKEAQWKQDWEQQKEEYEKSREPQPEVTEEEALETAEGVQVMVPTESVESTIEVPAETTIEAADVAASSDVTYYLADEFVNYVVETSYYQYAMLLQDATGQEVFTDVLEEYGWVNDYYELTTSTPFYAEYVHQSENETDSEKNAYVAAVWEDLSEEEVLTLLNGGYIDNAVRQSQLKSYGLLGYLTIEFDSFGKLSNIRLNTDDQMVYNSDVYPKAKDSISQYETNAECYVWEQMEDTSQNPERVKEVCPKNFRAIYLIYDNNERFVSNEREHYNDGYDYYDSYYEYEPYYAPYELYFATGAYWIVLALAVFVALAALILPFFKKLETGREKLFCMPFEIMAVVACCGIALAYGMCVFMSVSTMTELTTMIVDRGQVFELLGYKFSVSQCYYMVLFVNFLGWALAFFMEYICVAQIRQFFCGPMYYIKHRFIGIVFIRWIWKQCKKLYHYVTDIDIHKNLHQSILKIVLANFVIVALLCCIWFAGSLGAIIYSVVLYILLKKYGSKLQRQYQSILNATGQMAEGDLHITLEEDLGIFKPLGEELEGVQQGFAKAVAEEAKSQNMKSELITNVSHDLKTPLTAIITYVDLLKKEDITEEERKSYIETLDLKSQRLKVLIEDLFEVSKANSGNVKMNFMDVDIVKLMKEVRVEMSDKIEQSNLDFRWNLPEEKVVLSLDGQRTYRVFENLLNNAIKYAMPFTRVYVDILNKDSEVVITFKNMSAQELNFDAEHLTERFVRGDSSRNSEGSGLGLAIAKSFTELQHGQFDISVDGDLFKVTIRFLKN